MQFLHRFQAQWCGGIVQTQGIGGEIHQDRAQSGMVFGDFGKEFVEKWPHQTGNDGNHAAFFTDFHDAQGKRHHANQPQRNGGTCGGAVEHGFDDFFKNLGVTAQQLDAGHHKSDEEKRYPNVTQSHGDCPCVNKMPF